MAASTPVGSFPSPYEIETPPGCEGWEEMYPYYAVFDERRREQDEQRFWFWNSMHFPLPMPAFDLACSDVPYMGIAAWQNRVFAVPPAMGIDYRVVNGYIYISGNPVTDPAKIAERAEFFQKRAGYYFENWDELYAKWKLKMEALIAEITRSSRARPAGVRARRGRVRGRPQHGVRRSPRRLRAADALRRAHVAAPQRVPAARLRRLRDVRPTSARAPSPTSPTSTSRRWSPESTCSCSSRTPSSSGSRGSPSTPGWTRRSSRVARRRRSTTSSRGSEAGKAWLAELEKVKDPWFNMATGDGLYHYYRSWLDDPSIPYASLIGYVRALKRGRGGRTPDRGARTRARPARGGVRRAPRRGDAQGLRRAARALRHRLPVRRGAQVPLRLLVPDDAGGTRCASSARYSRSTATWRMPRTSSSSPGTSLQSALDELVLMWATGGEPLGPKHWPPIVARRREILERLGGLDSAARRRRHARGGDRPGAEHALGDHDRTRRAWARSQDGGPRADGSAGVAGRGRGRGAGREDGREIADVRDGEILVCSITSPAWAPIFTKVKAVVTDIGGVMSHAAIVCREYGLPAVVGTGRATSQIRTGQLVSVDGSAGTVTILD